MAITILPARLANQIAAGEVVERPASVIKELVENSIDAGATSIQIDIEKGGAKRIRITDNGVGIVKDELVLALSRHATSKIKSLDDLEAISSLGFRGEALASISSVARLTLTSKPIEQPQAWQAHAEGREMEVVIQPAAHPNGTTIDVTDLFFNTPARRKFMRTEKTEFTHIEEVIKRIALAHFNVSFVLNHNGKQVKNYRAINDPKQAIKRVAAVCGQSFIEHVIPIDCKHDDIHLSGWLAKPSFLRKQNDLCYSYVNGRMMRDKLINHAIRQAYSEFIDRESYPAFVLFLSLDFKEVDVNVHPAKHEVRFHQSRYVHDFIYSICHKALVGELSLLANDAIADNANYQEKTIERQYQQNQDFIKPLQQVNENNSGNNQTPSHTASSYSNHQYQPQRPSQHVNKIYQNLMTPGKTVINKDNNKNPKLLHIVDEQYGLYKLGDDLNLCDLKQLHQLYQQQKIVDSWLEGLVSQPLLLPIRLKIDAQQKQLIKQNETLLTKSGVIVNIQNTHAQIRQFPALLREKDVSTCFEKMLSTLTSLPTEQVLQESTWQNLLLILSTPEKITFNEAFQLWQQLANQFNHSFTQQLALKSVSVDLTSLTKQLH